MLHCIELNCILLYCALLYCMVLYCIVLYCIIMYCIVLYCSVLYCIRCIPDVLVVLLKLFALYPNDQSAAFGNPGDKKIHTHSHASIHRHIRTDTHALTQVDWLLHNAPARCFRLFRFQKRPPHRVFRPRFN